ncbi:MAG: alpha/beta hydrolase [Planctomycetota bacterium]|jgi:pimeloyl-ACP methyl ester carboxylesterase
MSTGAASVTAWSIEGSRGETILGNTHEPAGTPAGVVLVAHGFKGYKDYGMFPRIARELAAAGLVAHRFNFSHSGMTEAVETFARPDLFERDTWNRQVEDLDALAVALAAGRLEGQGLPCVLLGHSRGGVSVLLAAGRWASSPSRPSPAGVITVAAPATCNTLTPEQEVELLREGSLESPSSRTGQALRVGADFLREQQADPAGHDLTALVRRITCPLLVVHGRDDPTVPAESADAIGRAAGALAETLVINGADHVFNTPNPFPDDAAPSPQLAEMLDAVTAFALRCCAK